MGSNADSFLKKTLGDDFFESLQKFELWKPGTKTTVDHEEIKTALQIVPRTLMAMLIRELTPMKLGDNKDIYLPVGANALIKVTKHERDVYSGDILQDNKVVVDFKYRSIPGIGLIVLSAFELYDVSSANEAPKVEEDISLKVQKLIDERLSLHTLINQVVDKRISEKDALEKLILMRFLESMSARRSQPPIAAVAAPIPLPSPVLAPITKSTEEKPKGSPKLQSFLTARSNKAKNNEFQITMAKGEHVSCPDCGKNIFDGQAFSGCICLGADMDRKVFIKKSEDGIKVRFSKGWDQENIEMLLEVLRSKNG